MIYHGKDGLHLSEVFRVVVAHSPSRVVLDSVSTSTRRGDDWNTPHFPMRSTPFYGYFLYFCRSKQKRSKHWALKRLHRAVPPHPRWPSDPTLKCIPWLTVGPIPIVPGVRTIVLRGRGPVREGSRTGKSVIGGMSVIGGVVIGVGWIVYCYSRVLPVCGPDPSSSPGKVERKTRFPFQRRTFDNSDCHDTNSNK